VFQDQLGGPERAGSAILPPEYLRRLPFRSDSCLDSVQFGAYRKRSKVDGEGPDGVQAYVSLWSADLLALGPAVDLVGEIADGFHIDVFDGHNVRQLLFGPDLVEALRRRTTTLIDVHLNVDEPDYWARRFIDAGADMVTVQCAASPDIRATLGSIRAAGAQPSVGLEIHDPLTRATALFELADRILIMGTEIGIKGVELAPATAGRVSALVEARAKQFPAGRGPAIVVDGGIRAHTVGVLAAAGADGVVPGSLVFGRDDPVQAIRELHALGRTTSGNGCR
jgi:ribulose-phosphate 3-epimerase